MGLRSFTVNVPVIVGFAEAVKIAYKIMKKEWGPFKQTARLPYWSGFEGRPLFFFQTAGELCFKALGLSPEKAHGSLCITLGLWTKKAR